MGAFKLAPVLASGCTAVLKPSELTPMTALKLAECIKKAGVPDGVINVVPGFGNEAGQALISHPGVNKIAFTGSGPVGKHIMKTASETLKSVGLELGGKSPAIVMSDANLDVALAQCENGMFVHSGQYCMAATRLFV